MRSVSMQALTEDTRALHPGVVIYGIGDAAHQGSASGHNEDDTPGSRPEEEDADSKPEHRAIDVMIGPRFTTADGWNYVAALVNNPANSRRLRYVIFSRTIWRARNGWKPERYTGSDPHTNHVHVSGTAADDENGARYVLRSEPVPGNPLGDKTVKLIHTLNPTRFALVGDDFREITGGDVQGKANALATVWGNSTPVTHQVFDGVKAAMTDENE